MGLRNEHGLDAVAGADCEQPLARPVRGGRIFEHAGSLDPGMQRELFAQRLGEVGHAREVVLADLMHPAQQLLRAKRLFAKLREEAQRALAAVGLAGFERRPIEALSAGQFQRVLFARLIVQDAGMILLDEPLAAVDWRTREDLLRLIVSWQREGRTVAAVLHDLDQVRAYFPNTLLLARERVAWGPTREALMPQNLRRARHICETWLGEGENNRAAPRPRRAGLPRYPDPLPAPSLTLPRSRGSEGWGRSGEREGCA